MNDRQTSSSLAVLEDLPATAAYDEVAERYAKGGSLTVDDVLARADAMRTELLSSRFLYRTSSEARGARIERLEWMLDELIASPTLGFDTANGSVSKRDHDEVIDYLACRYEVAHK